MNRKSSRIITILLLLPFFLEFTDFKRFAISLPGSPYTLGQLIFALSGLLSLTTKRYKFNTIDKSLMVLWLGFYIGSFFSKNLEDNMSRAFGTLPILLGAIGFGIRLKDAWFRKIIDVVFLFTFIYWIYYVIEQKVITNSLTSYSELHIDEGALNHHIPGMYLSTLAIYVINKKFITQNRVQIWGWLLAGLVTILIILTESRSNLILFVTFFSFTLYFQNKKNLTAIFTIIVVGAVGFFIINEFVISQYDFLQQRFDFSDADYLDRSNRGREMVYQAFLPEFFSTPLGRGLMETRITLPGTNFSMLLHNQYATFILAGGIVNCVGVFVFFKGLFKLTITLFKYRFKFLYDSFTISYLISCLVLFSTIFTIEIFGSLLLSVYFGILSYLENEHKQINLLV